MSLKSDANEEQVEQGKIRLMEGEAPPRLVLNRAQAAEALGVSLRTFDGIVADRRNKVPRIKIARRVFFPVREFQDWLTRQAAC